MDKMSTQTPESMKTIHSSAKGRRAGGPKQQTVDFLRQFARAYYPAPIQGIILN